MSRSRLSALRKKELQELAESFNLSVEGRKADIEMRLVEYMKLHQNVLSSSEKYVGFYPSPSKQRRTSPLNVGQGGAGNTTAVAAGNLKSDDSIIGGAARSSSGSSPQQQPFGFKFEQPIQYQHEYENMTNNDNQPRELVTPTKSRILSPEPSSSSRRVSRRL